MEAHYVTFLLVNEVTGWPKKKQECDLELLHISKSFNKQRDGLSLSFFPLHHPKRVFPIFA